MIRKQGGQQQHIPNTLRTHAMFEVQKAGAPTGEKKRKIKWKKKVLLFFIYTLTSVKHSP